MSVVVVCITICFFCYRRIYIYTHCVTFFRLVYFSSCTSHRLLIMIWVVDLRFFALGLSVCLSICFRINDRFVLYDILRSQIQPRPYFYCADNTKECLVKSCKLDLCTIYFSFQYYALILSLEILVPILYK